MAYSTKKDILDLEMDEKTMIQLTDDKKTGDVVDAIVNATIAKADEDYIDLYCANRYTLPFNPVPGLIKRLSATIAGYYLHRRKQKVTNSILDKYTKAVSKLKSISTGDLPVEGVVEKDDSSGIASTTEDVVQTFTRTKKDAAGNIIGKPGSMKIW